MGNSDQGLMTITMTITEVQVFHHGAKAIGWCMHSHNTNTHTYVGLILGHELVSSKLPS